MLKSAFPRLLFVSLVLFSLLATPTIKAQAQTEPSLAPQLRSSIDDIAHQGPDDHRCAFRVGGGRTGWQDRLRAGLRQRASSIRPPRLRSAMRYSIGSISKQFTAAAILMLVEEGKLSLDDPVSKYVPGLTRGNEVTIRQLLSHTSGYQDLLAAGLRSAADAASRSRPTASWTAGRASRSTSIPAPSGNTATPTT